MVAAEAGGELAAGPSSWGGAAYTGAADEWPAQGQSGVALSAEGPDEPPEPAGWSVGEATASGEVKDLEPGAADADA